MYVQDVTWAPDSNNLLVAAITGEAQTESYSYDTSDLFLINLHSNDINLVNVLPEHTSLDFLWGLSWSPDGQKIAIVSVYPPPGNPQLYYIDVVKP